MQFRATLTALALLIALACGRAPSSPAPFSPDGSVTLTILEPVAPGQDSPDTLEYEGSAYRRVTAGEVFEVSTSIGQDVLGYPAIECGIAPGAEERLGRLTEQHVTEQMGVLVGDEIVMVAHLQDRIAASSFIIAGGSGGFTTDEVNEVLAKIRTP